MGYSMKVIDSHVHIGLNSFCTSEERLLPYDLENRYNDYINVMRQADVERACILPIPDIGYDATISNNYLKEAFEYSNGMLLPICRLNETLNYPSRFAWRAKKSKNHYSYIANLILPECCGELFECSVRETRYSWYKEKFMEAGISDCYSWYLDSLKYDESSRVGFGLGIERLARWLCDCEKIEYMHAFPRTNMYLD